MDLKVASNRKIELQDITKNINLILPQIEFEDHRDAITIFVPHTTAAITINENADPDVVNDLQQAWETLVPEIPYQHIEGNSPAHFLSSVIGPSITVPVKNKQLDLGRWQGIFFCEFDGPRTRKIKLLR